MGTEDLIKTVGFKETTYVMMNKLEFQKGVSSILRGSNCGRQRLCGPGELATGWCLGSIKNVQGCGS